MLIRKILAVVLLLPSFVIAQTARQDVWEPFKYFVGNWEGTGKGQPGVSKMQREYKFVLNGKFLHVQNRSVYEPQAKNPKGEVHEDWDCLALIKAENSSCFGSSMSKPSSASQQVWSIAQRNRIHRRRCGELVA